MPLFTEPFNNKTPLSSLVMPGFVTPFPCSKLVSSLVTQQPQSQQKTSECSGPHNIFHITTQQFLWTEQLTKVRVINSRKDSFCFPTHCDFLLKHLTTYKNFIHVTALEQSVASYLGLSCHTLRLWTAVPWSCTIIHFLIHYSGPHNLFHITTQQLLWTETINKSMSYW